MNKFAQRLLITLCIIILAFALAIAVFLHLRRTRQQPESRQPRRAGLLVETIKAQSESARVLIKGFGSAEAQSSLALVAQVSGRIESLNPDLRAGSLVKKGDLLVLIDPRPYQVAIERAKATVDQAQAAVASIDKEKQNLLENLKLAKQEEILSQRSFLRARNLLETGAGTESVRDQAEQAWLASQVKVQTIENTLALIPERLASAQATLAQNVATLHDAELKLEYTEIRAPFEGRVAQRRVEPGQFVGVGTPLAEIYNPDILEIPVRISLKDLSWIPSPDQESSDQRPTARVILRLTGQYQAVWSGHLTRLDRRLDPQSRTAGAIIEVRKPVADLVSLPGTDTTQVLTPGTFVEVEIDGRTLENTFVLPRGIISPEGNIHLYREGSLEIRPVEIVRSEEAVAYITGGLTDGDQIVTTIIAAPVQGMKLRINGNGPESGATPDRNPQTGSARGQGR